MLPFLVLSAIERSQVGSRCYLIQYIACDSTGFEEAWSSVSHTRSTLDIATVICSINTEIDTEIDLLLGFTDAFINSSRANSTTTLEGNRYSDGSLSLMSGYVIWQSN